jgi:hypothetical protein
MFGDAPLFVSSREAMRDVSTPLDMTKQKKSCGFEPLRRQSP